MKEIHIKTDEDIKKCVEYLNRKIKSKKNINGGNNGTRKKS